MKIMTVPRRKFPPAGWEPATHLFTIGQTVRLKGSYGRPPRSAEIFRITGTLPPAGNSPQYRIRNDEEHHERVATQDNLELFTSRHSEAETLIERTFGHG